MFDRLVFVEGPTDEATLREWASTLNLNLIQANVGFVSMGGVRNFAHYATEAILSLLTRRQVGMWFVIDRDERDTSEVAQLGERMKEKAKVEVLAKREIENYLLAPRAVTEFILMKQALVPGTKKVPDEASVVRVLSECADELKEFAIAKHVAKSTCKPIYPSSKLQPEDFKGGIEVKLSEELEKLRQEIDAKIKSLKENVEKQTRAIEETWGREKLNVVPGDLLLDNVCKRFGVRFKKDLDSARLAAMMKEDEIDFSIRSLLRQIAN
jgi:hypothetical protein